MALINCPECGCQVSEKANCCPHCGFPVASNKNEKLYFLKLMGDFGDDDIEDMKSIELLRSVANCPCKLESTKLITTEKTFPHEIVWAMGQQLHRMGYKSLIVPDDNSSFVSAYSGRSGPRCPKCGSTSVQYALGFSIGKAAAGTVLFGPIGAVAGLVGNKYKRVCVSCGHKF